MATEALPRGLQMEKLPLKSRQRSIYWRPHANSDGETIWIETLPLPSDLEGRELYLSKGFRLSPPGAETPVEVDTEKEDLLAENARLRAQIKTQKKGKRA